MHRCLLLPDIFPRVLDFLIILPYEEFYAGYQQSKDQNPSIARLARTCRHFLEPCLDRLWQTQRTLRPLVRTLPPDAYKETKDRRMSKPGTPRVFRIVSSTNSMDNVLDDPFMVSYQRLIRPLVKSDWSRFDYYSVRIRALGFYHNEFADEEGLSWNASSSSHREREVAPLILRQLALSRRGRWLLPNLVRLRWNIYDFVYNEHISLFFSPSLRSPSFAFEPESLPRMIIPPA
ncbi:hypothetical protein OH77DRAFT_1017087 [Trametes cingulata]|nr:hypothetical protein OH77DRAFT_1017087 [Trametes cingulata]